MRRVSLIISLYILLCMAAAIPAQTPGDVIMRMNLPGLHPQGLAFDGRHIWCADRLSDQIYKLDPDNGAIIDSLPAPGYHPVGLTWDGSHLWCVDGGEERIYAIDPKTGIAEKTIWCPAAQPGDLAWDGMYLWICDDASNEIMQISTVDGTTISSITAPHAHPGGLTFDGTYLWVSDRYRDAVYMVTPDNGDVIITLDSIGHYPCGLAWSPDALYNVDYENKQISALVATASDNWLARFDDKQQKVSFIHQSRNFGPDTVTSMQVYLALPENRESQQLHGDVKLSPPPDDIITDDYGQKLAVYEFSDLGPGDFTEVELTAVATLYRTRYHVFPGKVGSLDDIPDDIKKIYLADDEKYAMNDPVIQQAVAVAVGDETNPYWIGRKVFKHLIDKMYYELVGGWNIAPTVLDRGNGSCSEYSFVYISMCRAAGLPARYVGAVVIRGDDASWDDVFHRWVEIYLPNYGWFPVDPSGGDKEWPADQANYFGALSNRFLITTQAGGGTDYLGWSYNANEVWKSKGKCKIETENFGEWSPAILLDDAQSR